MAEWMIQLIQLVLSLTIMVIVHEFGHFFFSKLFGVRVEKFYIFFDAGLSLVRIKKIDGHWRVKFLSRKSPKTDSGKTAEDRAWEKKDNNTEFGIGWLPLGGYCKIAGMVDESLDNEQLKSEPQKWEYRGVSTWKRLPIITGGVLMNFILAIVIISCMMMKNGETIIKMQDISRGFVFSEAAKDAGFEDGDRIIAIDGKHVEKLDEEAIRNFMKAEIVEIERTDSANNITCHTISTPEDFGQSIIDEKALPFYPLLPFVVDSVLPGSPAAKADITTGDSVVGINGTRIASASAISAKLHKNAGKALTLNVFRNGNELEVKATPGEDGMIGVVMKSFSYFYAPTQIQYGPLEALIAGTGNGIKKLTGYVSDLRYVISDGGMNNLGGFKSIGESFSPQWDWDWFWNMTAMLSIMLAFMNILPIPGLDGGHLMFLIYEMLTGRKPGTRFLMTAQLIGMGLLLWLVLYANINDFIR